jgi:hypothetical protein
LQWRSPNQYILNIKINIGTKIPEHTPIVAARQPGLLHGNHRKHINVYNTGGITNARSHPVFQSSICKVAAPMADTKNIIPSDAVVMIFSLVICSAIIMGS